MRRPFGAIAVVGLFVVVVPLAAHDTWLLPSSMRVPVGRQVTLSLTSGMAFPVDDFAIAAKRVTRANVRLAGATTNLATPAPSTLSLRYRWTPSATGIAAIALELAPKSLVLAPEKIEEYFLDINASKSLRAAWDSIPSPKQWRESYSKHASSFVRVGEPVGDSSWHAPLGMGFELLPEDNPTELRAGQTVHVRALRRGTPVANLEVGFQVENETNVSFATTDANGRASMKLSKDGRWLIHSTNLRRTRKPNLEWESDFATMTVAVRR